MYPELTVRATLALDKGAVMEYQLSEHAAKAIAERGIKLEWIQRALVSPELIMAHPDDPELNQHFLRITENGDRILRVIFNGTTSPPRVVTTYFDRAARKLL